MFTLKLIKNYNFQHTTCVVVNSFLLFLPIMIHFFIWECSFE